MFAPRASMVPIGRSSVVPADLPPAPHEEILEEPAVQTPSRVKRMFRSSMEHMKKVRLFSSPVDLLNHHQRVTQKLS